MGLIRTKDSDSVQAHKSDSAGKIFNLREILGMENLDKNVDWNDFNNTNENDN